MLVPADFCSFSLYFSLPLSPFEILFPAVDLFLSCQRHTFEMVNISDVRVVLGEPVKCSGGQGRP